MSASSRAVFRAALGVDDATWRLAPVQCPLWSQLTVIVSPAMVTFFTASGQVTSVDPVSDAAVAIRSLRFAPGAGVRARVTLPVALGKTSTPYQTDWGTLGAGGMVSFLPLVAVVFLLQREMVRGFTLGAVK